MLRDSYEIDKFFVDIQGLTSEMEPELAQIDKVLEDQDIYQKELFFIQRETQAIWQDKIIH